MVLGQIVALEMVNKHMKLHKICFNTYKVIAKVKVCHYDVTTTMTTTRPPPTTPG